jgi:XTP/dITP diphosphohydrolase
MKIIFATNNTHKVIEAQKVLGNNITLIMPKEIGAEEEIPENGLTLEANAEEKCRYIWDKFHLPCFADDTGLEVEALKGAPGVYTARYAGESKDTEANMNKLLHELSGKENRKAQFRTAIALIIEGKLYRFEGVLKGSIAKSKSGMEGFGYDPVFIPEEYNKTLAELSLNEKNTISHRGKSMRALSRFLQERGINNKINSSNKL